MPSTSSSPFGVNMHPLSSASRRNLLRSVRVYNKSDEEIIKKLNSHPERLSSGELAKTLLGNFSRNLGSFSSRTTIEVYLRWLEAQRQAKQSTINFNWRNVIMQWAQSLKARNFTLKQLIYEVENWKRMNGPFEDPKTEEKSRYPPTIDELEFAYKMDLKAHVTRRTSVVPSPRGRGDHYSPDEAKKNDRVSEGPSTAPVCIEKQWCEHCKTRTTSETVSPAETSKRAKEDAYCCSKCRTPRDQFVVSRQETLFGPTMSLSQLKMQETVMSSIKHPSSSSNGSLSRTMPTIGLFVMNVGKYTHDEVLKIFHPDCRHTIVHIDVWLTNRTVHFTTIMDRDRAYFLLPEDLRKRKEKDLTRPLVQIYSDTGNKPKSNSDTGHSITPRKDVVTPKKEQVTPTRSRPLEVIDEGTGLWVMNVEDYIRKAVENLFDERDILNIVGIERWGKSNMVVQFPTTYLRDRALDHLSSRFKEPRQISNKNIPLVVLFKPGMHGKREASPRGPQSTSPDKFYSARKDMNDNRSFNAFTTSRRKVSREGSNHGENHDYRHPDRRFADDGRLSRYDKDHDMNDDIRHPDRRFGEEIQNNSYCKDPILSKSIGPEENCGDKNRLSKPDPRDLIATLWLDKLGEEIMERRSNTGKNLGNDSKYLPFQNYRSNIEGLKGHLQDQNMVDRHALIVDTYTTMTDVSAQKFGLKRCRSPDDMDSGESDYGHKRARFANTSSSSDDEDELDCSFLVLSRMRRPTALQMWNSHDQSKLADNLAAADVDKSALDGGGMDGVEHSSGVIDGDDDNDAEPPRARGAGYDLTNISSPEDGWCSSRDYWAGSSGDSDVRGREENANNSEDSPVPNSDTQSGDSGSNQDAEMAYSNVQAAEA